MYEKIIVKVNGGKLIAVPSTDPNYPGIWISYIKDGSDFEQDLVLVENPNGGSSDTDIQIALFKRGEVSKRITATDESYLFPKEKDDALGRMIRSGLKGIAEGE